ncbi:MAG: hypothetical protein IK115_07085 [Lachnospiraceae bacterium]|nr:hypothetical protein [Lachnospiraceae bacterium]
MENSSLFRKNAQEIRTDQTQNRQIEEQKQQGDLLKDLQNNIVQDRKSVRQEEEKKELEQLADPLKTAEVDANASFEDAFVNIEGNALEQILDAADNFAPTLGRTSSYAMKQVKRELLAVKAVHSETNLNDEEKSEKLQLAIYALQDACERYKAVKFRRGQEPKNARHRRVAAILSSCNKALAKYGDRIPQDVIGGHENAENRISALKGKPDSEIGVIKGRVRVLREMLSKPIPLRDKVIGDDLRNLVEHRYNNVIEDMERYLKNHISWSREKESRYRVVNETIRQIKMEKKRYELLNVDTIRKMVKAGTVSSWGDLLKSYGKENEDHTKIVEKKEADREVQASAVASLAGSVLYGQFEKADEEGSFVSREAVTVSKAQAIEMAKKKKQTLRYSDQALLQLYEARILDMILGIEQRGDDSIRFEVEPMIYHGQETLMIRNIWLDMPPGNELFSAKEAEGDLKLPSLKMGFNRREYSLRKKKFKEYRDSLAERLKELQPETLKAKLKELGVELSEEQTTAFFKRLEAVKTGLAGDDGDGKDYVDPDLLIDKEQNYRKNELLETELGRKKLEQQKNLGKKRKQKGKGEVKEDPKPEEEEKKNELSHSEKHRLSEKRRIMDEIRELTWGKSGCYRAMNEEGAGPDPMEEILNLLNAWYQTDIDAEKASVNLVLSKEKRKFYEQIREEDNSSDAAEFFAAVDGELEEYDRIQSEPASSSEHKSDVRRESEYLAAALEKIKSYKAVIESRIKALEKVPEDKEYRRAYYKDMEVKLGEDGRFILPEGVLPSQVRKTKNGTYFCTVMKKGKNMKLRDWERERTRLEKLEATLSFRNGQLKDWDNDEEKHIDATDFVFYREKDDDEAGITDATGAELPFVKEELRDATKEPLFAHEPCIEDVMQGHLGDCYFLATLATIVERKPAFIKDLMRDLGDAVMVRFFDPEGNAVFVKVKKTVATSYAKETLWVQLLEKAYVASGLSAQYGKFDELIKKEEEERQAGKEVTVSEKDLKQAKDFRTLENLSIRDEKTGEVREVKGRSYKSVAGGTIDQAFRILNGPQLEKSFFFLHGKAHSDDDENMPEEIDEEKEILKMSEEEVKAKYGADVNTVLFSIEKALSDPDAEYALVASTRDLGKTEDEEGNLNHYRNGVAGPHQYTLLGIEEKDGKKMIRLRNPWGYGKLHYEEQQSTGQKMGVLGDDLDTGSFLMDPLHFVTHFFAIDKIPLTYNKLNLKKKWEV